MCDTCGCNVTPGNRFRIADLVLFSKCDLLKILDELEDDPLLRIG